MYPNDQVTNALNQKCVYIYIFVFQSLLELHKRRKAVTEPEVRYYMTSLLKGVQYLHNNRVIHRDLKLGNIFLNDDMDVKIGKHQQ